MGHQLTFEVSFGQMPAYAVTLPEYVMFSYHIG